MWILYVILLILSCVGKKSKRESTKTNLRNYIVVSVILSILFVVAWSFALAGTDSEISAVTQEVSQYIFAVFIALHAVFLLILHTIRSPHAQESWRSMWYTIRCKRNMYVTKRTFMTNRDTELAFNPVESTGMSLRGEDAPLAFKEMEVSPGHAHVVENTYITTPTDGKMMKEEEGPASTPDTDDEDGVATRL